MIQTLSLSDIKPARFRLREDVGDLEELKESMKVKGLLQPIVVRQVNKHYEIIAGERRFVSAHEIGWTEIEAKIIEATDQEAFEFALLENLQRKSMDPLEEGAAFHTYVNKYGYGSASDLAKKIGKSPGYVSGRLSIIDTSPDIRAMIKSDKLSVSDAVELSRAIPGEMEALAKLSSDVGLTTHQIRSATNLVNQGMDSSQAVNTVLVYPNYEAGKTHKTFDPISIAREQLVLTLERALKDLDSNINRLAEGEERAKWTHEVRYPVHQVVSVAMNIRKEYDKR